MDGNGRWAEKNGLPRSEGHRAGTEVVKMVVRTCVQKKIDIVSLFAFGSENWARPTNEVDGLMDLFLETLGSGLEELHDNGVKLQFIGDRSQLLPQLQEQMRIAETLMQDNHALICNVLINYSGKWDIVQATKTLAGRLARGEMSVEAIDETCFQQFLSTHPLPNPDLLIRTSGEQRISNCFLWQLAYTEMYFSSVCWPEFSRQEFERALDFFHSRERRFGKTSGQVTEDTHV